VDTTPWSSVTVDGRAVGNTPIIGLELPAGSHTVGFSNPETGASTSIVVTIEPGKRITRRLGLE
jgi:serine/threonine-protein kinase